MPHSPIIRPLRHWPAVLWLCIGLLFANAAHANEEVDVELVLAADVSASIDPSEARLQRRGYAEAIVHPDVLDALASGIQGRIAIAYIEWADHDRINLIADWHIVHDLVSARTLSAKILGSPRNIGVQTSISAVIDFASLLLDTNGFSSTRRVIDISADGANNNGELVTRARDRAIARGITINGLPILNDRPNAMVFPPLKNLDLYFSNCVVGGVGAFIVVASNFEAFGAAIRRKMVLEIAGTPSRRWQQASLLHGIAATAPAVQRQPGGRVSPTCDIGERRLRKFLAGFSAATRRAVRVPNLDLGCADRRPASDSGVRR